MFKKKPKLSREEALAMKPLVMVDAQMELDGKGNGRLTVRLRSRRVFIFKLPEGATRTYEFDPVGVYVWQQLDGKLSVERLIRQLARKYDLDLRQAEASTVAFLKMLMHRGLVGVVADQSQD